jgi:hypothetical protein
MAQKPKAAKSKPDPVIEALQRELKQQGYYSGEIDGQAGDKTTEAVARRDAVIQRNRELEIEALKAQGGKTTADATAAATAAETDRKKRYSDQASSGWGMAAQGASNLVAPAAGTALGMALGKGVNYGMDKAQESRNRVLQATARDRVAGLTTREGAREGARLAGAMPLSNPAARTVSRMAPHIGLGALSIGKGAQVLADSNPEGEFYNQMADRGAGLGYIGAGAGLIKQGLRYAAAPGVAPDAQSIAVINSNQLRRNNVQPDAPEAPPPKQTPRGMLVEQAKAAGIKNVGKKNMGQLSAAIEAAKKGLPKAGVLGPLAVPAAAGALAFGMTPDRAEASTDGSEGGGNTAEALTNAGIAGGGAAVASRYAGPVLGALGRAAGPVTPFAAADLSDNMSQADLNTGQNWMARNAPFTRHLPGSSIGKAYDMAQVPTANPERRAMGPRRVASFEQALADFQALMGAQ